MGVNKGIDLSKYGIVHSKDRKLYANFLVYGEWETGKTTFGLTFPGPILVIDTERGSGELGKKSFVDGQTDDFFVLEFRDPRDLVERLESMYHDGLFTDEHDLFKTIMIDPATRFWDALKDEYQAENNSSFDWKSKKKVEGDTLFKDKIQLNDWGNVKAPLKRVLRQILLAPCHKIIMAHSGTKFITNEKGKMEADGTTFKMEGTVGYDARVMLELIKEEEYEGRGRERRATGRYTFKAIVNRDNSGTYRPGDIISNPKFDMWSDFYGTAEGYPDPRRNTVVNTTDPGLVDKIMKCLADEEISGMMTSLGIKEGDEENGERWNNVARYGGDKEVIRKRMSAALKTSGSENKNGDPVQS